MSDSIPKRPKWVTFLLLALPLWLVVSGVLALWFHFHQEKEQALVEQEKFARKVSIPMIEDDLRKLVETLGERNGSSESAAKNLTRTSSMIEGLLGPANTGFTVIREPGPADWPLLQVTIKGTDQTSPAIWVISSYDSRPGSPGVEANATGLAATLAAAQALAGEKPRMNLHFVFLPHANDPEAPVLEMVSKIRQMIDRNNPPGSMLCVEAMGAGEELWLSTRETKATPLAHVQGLGNVRGAEVVCLGEDADLASLLFEAGLPAVRVSTRPVVLPEEPDDKLPSAVTVAAATGRLVELIRRCAGLR